jgi:hypothetical protein
MLGASATRIDDKRASGRGTTGGVHSGFEEWQRGESNLHEFSPTGF